MKFNNNFKYDLHLGQLGEKMLSEILSSKKIEVKTDFKAHQTGNIFIEYESRNRPSGIATSEADYYCFIITKKCMIIIEKERLKRLCRKYTGTSRDKRGGDENTSKGILLPIKDLIN